MSGDNEVFCPVLCRIASPETMLAFNATVQAAEEADKLDEIEHRAADMRVRQLLREGAL